MEGSLIKELIAQGGMGLLAAIALYVAYKKDRMVDALYTRLVEKSEKDSDKYQQLAGVQNETMRELTEAVDNLIECGS